jgi:hypothetical protein
MASNFFKNMGDKIADFVDWARGVMEDEAIRKSIAEDLGLQAGQSIGKPAAQPLTSVDSYRANANPDQEAFVALLNDARSLYASVRTAVSGFGSTDVTRINSITYLIFDMLALNYVRLYLPRTYFFVQAANAIVEDTSAVDDSPLVLEHFMSAYAQALLFALSPGYYIWKVLDTEDADQAQKVADGVFPHLAALFMLGPKLSSSLEPIATKEVICGWDAVESKTPNADRISRRMLTFAFPLSQKPTAVSDLAEHLGFTLAPVPRANFIDIGGSHFNDPGLFVGVSGEGKVEIPAGERWKFVAEASARPAFSFLLRRDGWFFNLGAGHTPTNVPLNVAFASIPDATNVSFAIPRPDGTRIDVGQLAFSFSFNGTNGGIKAQALRCALVLATEDQDGFLSRFLPKDGLRVPFNLGIGFSTEKGFFTEEGIDWPTGRSTPPSGPSPSPAIPRARVVRRTRDAATLSPSKRAAAAVTSRSSELPIPSGAAKPELGIQATIPIRKSLLAVTLESLFVSISPSTKSSVSGVKTEVSLSLAVKIGPVTAVVDRIGFEASLSFPESGGNMGFADLSVGFKAPRGVGIKIDSPFVSGGGFLDLDPANGQYAGFVQLTLQSLLTVTAIGVISTRLPRGAKGFSFVVMITAQGFKPIQLGLGFTLTGIGGLLAINRTCNEEFLREGIKNNTLEDLLFPRDPIRNAAKIFGTLNSAFPALPGSYLFGPILQICWGTPPLITMDLGVILEIGNRKRLVVLGRVTAVMPSEAHDLIRLQMNALGVIDFDQDSISLDADLFDSRLAGRFPITGSMAMRLNWGSAPQFALSIGGFHPAFKPPANFPRLERLAITFSNTDSYQLRGDCYIAVTSNTLQLGASMHLYVRVSGFSVEGHLGIDVLIQFSPFGFIAGFLVSFQLKRGSYNLFKVRIDGELTGPRPLHIKGTASFEIFWCDFSVSVDHTFIKGDRPPALEPVAVTPRLIAALRDARNWSGQLAEKQRRMVTLREPSVPDMITLHPLGRLSVKQTVVPLNLDISRFGSATPADAHRFEVNSNALSLSGKVVPFDRVEDFFAPSQFLNLTDDEKLAAPSFEPLMAGLSVSADTFLFTSNPEDIVTDDELRIETIIVDSEFSQLHPPPPAALRPETLNMQVLLGAASRADVRRSGTERYRPSGPKHVNTSWGWSVASRADGSPQAAPGVEAGKVTSYAESFQALQRLKQQNPNRAKSLMLVRTKTP